MRNGYFRNRYRDIRAHLGLLKLAKKLVEMEEAKPPVPLLCPDCNGPTHSDHDCHHCDFCGITF